MQTAFHTVMLVGLKMWKCADSSAVNSTMYCSYCSPHSLLWNV